MQKRKLDLTKQYTREFRVDRAAVNSDARTVEIAFSSEEPYDRWFGTEILDHGPKAIRLGRLKDGGPLLMDHNTRDQVGVVESVKIGADRVGRAVVRFGKSARAEEIFNDVVEGIRQKVSVGYMIHELILDSKQGDTDTYRVLDWEPFEISIVSVPADNSVGVGREHEQIEPKKEIKSMTTTNENPAPKDPPVDVKAIETKARDEARKAEMQRIKDIESTGQTFAQFGGVELARQHIAEGKTVEELNAALLDRAGKKKPATAELGLEEKEIKQYSFLRIMNALANPTDRKAQEAAGYEIELSRAAADKAGKQARGIMIPVDVLRAPTQQRDLTVGTATAGGHTVSTDLLSDSFIELLRKRMVTQRLGVRVLNGLVGNIAIPRHTGATTAYWVAESGSPTEGQQAFDQVTMSPKTVGAYTDISRKLLIQSSIDVEGLVRDDLAKVLGLEIDRVAFYGSGSSNQPQGLQNVSGINTKDFAADAPTWAEIVAMETEVAADNADIGTLAYATNARGRGVLKTTEKASSTAQFIWGPDNQVNGYRTEVSNQISLVSSGKEHYWFGNWDDQLIGFWGGLDLMVDPYTGSTSGTVRIVALQDVDTAVRHPESFCLGSNLT